MPGRDPEETIVDHIKDRLAESVGKKHVGFDPNVCQGCPHRGPAPMKACGLCGCPTLPGMPLDRTNTVPANCPRIDQHAEQGGGEDIHASGGGGNFR